jgi:tetratricopeptide (TPR) repeat protein
MRGHGVLPIECVGRRRNSDSTESSLGRKRRERFGRAIVYNDGTTLMRHLLTRSMMAAVLLLEASAPCLADFAAWAKAVEAGQKAYHDGDYAAAVGHFETAAKQAEGFAANDTRLGGTLEHLGTAYAQLGRLDDAEHALTRAVAALEKALDPYHPDLAGTLQKLATVYQQEKKYAEAEKIHLRTLKITQTALKADDPTVASALSNVAAIQALEGKIDSAITYMERAAAIRDKKLKPTDPLLATTHRDLGNLYTQKGDAPRAAVQYVKGVDALQKETPVNTAELDKLQDRLALTYVTMKAYADAEAVYQRMLTRYEKDLGPAHPQVGATLYKLANVSAASKDLDKAAERYKRALAIYTKALGPDHVEVGRTLFSLGRLYVEQGRFAEGERAARQAVEVFKVKLKPDHPYFALSLLNWAAALEGLGKTEQAQQIKEAVAQLHAKQPPQLQPSKP